MASSWQATVVLAQNNIGIGGRVDQQVAVQLKEAFERLTAAERLLALHELRLKMEGAVEAMQVGTARGYLEMQEICVGGVRE